MTIGRSLAVTWTWLMLASALSPGGATAGESRVALPALPSAKGEACVEPTPIMRRDHMDFLLHQRDATVHDGIRGTKHSLIGCIDCHVQRDGNGTAIPVNAPGQFCDGCHRYAGVSMDCFECHATTPGSDAAWPAHAQ